MSDKNVDMTSVEYLRETAQRSVETYYESYQEAYEMHLLYHGYHFDQQEYNTLKSQKIPFLRNNEIRKYTDLIVGYMGTIVSTVKITPQQEQDVHIAELFNDYVNLLFRQSAWDTADGKQALAQFALNGLLCIERVPVDAGRTDRFGRSINDYPIKFVPVYDVYLDPASRELDYSDARFIHRQQWMTKEEMEHNFPDVNLEELRIGGDSIGSAYNISNRFQGASDIANIDNYSDMYNVVHSCVVTNQKADDEPELDPYTGEVNDTNRERVYSIYWCHDKILEKKETTYRGVKFPYLIYKLHREDIAHEFYGMFRDAVPHQRAINQLEVLTLRMSNTPKKIIGKKGLVKGKGDIAKFTRQMNAINSHVQVNEPEHVKDAYTTGDIQEKLMLIKHHKEEIESVLGINPSFMGVANASDSGRKVEIQRAATVSSLKTFESRVQEVYRILGRDLVSLISQFSYAHQSFNISEPDTVARYLEINVPEVVMKVDDNGQPVLDENGEPLYDYVFEPARDQESGEILTNESGDPIWVPKVLANTEIRYFNHDIVVDTTLFNDEKESAALFAQQLLNSSAGAQLAEIDPAEYLRIWGLLGRGYKNSATNQVAESLLSTSNKMREAQEAAQAQGDQNANN